MARYFLDTNILINATKSDHDPLGRAARLLLERFEPSPSQVGKRSRRPSDEACIPMICVAEYLAPIEDLDQVKSSLDELAEKYELIPFDYSAVLWAARLHRMWAYVRDSGIERQAFKVDCEIVACAIAYNADFLVTCDRKLGNFVKNRNVQELCGSRLQVVWGDDPESFPPLAYVQMSF